MFELLVPPEKEQLAQVGGDKNAYDLQLRPTLMVEAIEALQEAGVEPDVWKIEGLDRREDCEKIVAAVRRGGRDKVGCIVLGRGENDAKVHEWLASRGQRTGIHRLCRRADRFLAAARRLAGEENRRARPPSRKSRGGTANLQTYLRTRELQ